MLYGASEARMTFAFGEAPEIRVSEYLPPGEVLAIRPSAVDLKRRGEYRKARPGDDFALVLYEGGLVMVPSWHPLNQTSKSANSIAYGTGSMETFSFEPVTTVVSDSQGVDIVGANIILLEPRMERLYGRSFPARELQFPVGKEAFTQGVVDLMAILGRSVLVGEGGNMGVGSIRVTVGPGVGKFGKSAIGREVEASVESYFGQKSFPERAYRGSGLIVSAGPNQRFQKFYGKHSSHYGDGGRIGAMAKGIGADDAIFFAPYCADDQNHVCALFQCENDSRRLEHEMLRLALADGLGAELLAIRRDGKVLLPPMAVNRLGGVTADYIMRYLAPSLGIPTEESLFSLQQVLDGEIVGLFFAGNAARVAAIGAVILHDARGNILNEIRLVVHGRITSLIDRFEKEVRGIIPPSHSSLVTKVDLESGQKAREILERTFVGWM